MAEQETVEHWRNLYGGMAGAMNIIRRHVGLPPHDAASLALSGAPTPNGEAIEICRAIDAKISASAPSGQPRPSPVPRPEPSA